METTTTQWISALAVILLVLAVIALALTCLIIYVQAKELNRIESEIKEIHKPKSPRK